MRIDYIYSDIYNMKRKKKELKKGKIKKDLNKRKR